MKKSGTHKKNLVKFEKIEITNGENCSKVKQATQGHVSSLFKPSLSVFPSELVLKIFGFLPHSDLNSCIKVCMKFRDIGTDPLLWSKFYIPAMEISQEEGLDRLLVVLKLPRFRKLQKLDLNRVYSTNLSEKFRNKFIEILSIAAKLPLSWLDLSYNHLTYLAAPQFLANLVLNIPHVVLFATKAKLTFYSTLLDNLSEGSALNNLSLGGLFYLDTLPINLVSKLNCVTSLALEGTCMTLEQVRVFLTDMAAGTNLKRLNLQRIQLSLLDPGLVARAVVQVEKVVMECTLPRAHVLAILGQIDESSRLGQLDLGKNDVSKVPGHFLETAVNFLKRGGGSVVLKKVGRKLFLRF